MSARVGRVMISYAHESPTHEQLVGDFHAFLCAQGIDAHIDQSVGVAPQVWPLWVEREFPAATYVLVIASPAYRRRAVEIDPSEQGRGVHWEAGLIRDALYHDSAARAKYLGVLLPGATAADLPTMLLPSSVTHYRVRSFTQEGAAKLLAVLTGLDQPPSVPSPPQEAKAIAVRITVTGGDACARDDAVRAAIAPAAEAGRTVELPPERDGRCIALVRAEATDLDLVSHGLYNLTVATRAPLTVTVGASLSPADAAAAEAARLVDERAVRRLHDDWPQFPVIVALSESLFAQWHKGSEPWPDPASFGRREADGQAYQVAVVGQGTCPPDHRPTRPDARHSTGVHIEAPYSIGKVVVINRGGPEERQ